MASPFADASCIQNFEMKMPFSVVWGTQSWELSFYPFCRHCQKSPFCVWGARGPRNSCWALKQVDKEMVLVYCSRGLFLTCFTILNYTLPQAVLAQQSLSSALVVCPGMLCQTAFDNAAISFLSVLNSSLCCCWTAIFSFTQPAPQGDQAGSAHRVKVPAFPMPVPSGREGLVYCPRWC